MSDATFNSVAAEIGELVTEKNAAYGDSFAKCGDFLRLLFPDGITPEQYGDALAMVRIFDKQMRIATRKDALGESPYKDIAGYGILGVVKDTTSAPLRYPPAHPYKHKDEIDASRCDSCHEVGLCMSPLKGEEGGCDGYTPALPSPPADPWAERDLCRRCDYEPCVNHGREDKTAACDTYANRTKQPHLACTKP